MSFGKTEHHKEEGEPLQRQKEKSSFFGLWAGGVAFTFFIALLGFLLARIPGFSLIGQMASAILIAVVFRQIFGYPEALRSGVAFSSKVLLRTAIVLYGLKLNIHTVLQDGLGLLIRDAGIITIAILVTVWVAKRLRANPVISLLLGVGTGVCGAAAIAAVAPIIKAKDEDTAISVGIIALVGTVFGIVYTILRPVLPLTGAEYGAWTGMSLHEIAHVVLAGAPGGQEALAMALLAKLGRVFLLIPLCFILVYWVKSRSGKDSTGNAKVGFPLFLLGFIAMSIIGTYVLGAVIVVPQGFMDFVSSGTTWLLTAAMVGLGLNVSLQDVRTKALKPLLAMSVASVLISVLAFLLV
ncbi:putative integral membrane protein (TIGR00698 family) [Bacillus thermophilus]|uniref:Integral membrane protein (TIGR00698 family) n=1 Tax=Siminovitchia thermophila TaxID=1245522 RepID=A0ABS2R5K8_9BACI|nr:putative sulfate exporter family transporter [Siminovitchia thermophila]MBM7714941.1 putative integral membrane protein (TIGR00698 family) [Siminovitchia thermophila]